MEQQELIPHLFRTEHGKITAVLCRLMGIGHIDVAEDIASETFLAALEVWPYKGVPANPVAWLYTVAKNMAHNYMGRHNLFARKVAKGLQQTLNTVDEPEIDLTDAGIADSQLRMLFAICHPVISVEAQIGLALRVLCGFGVDEIANALLTTKDTINKRLYRAKEKLREAQIEIAMPTPADVEQRLERVLTVLYLLFSEGYYSESNDVVLREDLCLEAMRLAYLLINHKPTNLPSVNALMALMCFHASRFAARKGDNGAIILYADQDEALWDKALIAKGGYYLHEGANGHKLSKYHIEASIAYWHTVKEDTSGKWENILQLYNQLLRLEYSPIAALNRTYALAKANGKTAAITEAEQLQLTGNHYYYMLLGELYTGIDAAKAMLNFETAYALAKTEADKQTIWRRLETS